MPADGAGEGCALKVNFADVNILADQLASFGPGVLVVSPPGLREQVLARLLATARAHGAEDLDG